MSNDILKSERVKAVEEMIEETGCYGRAVQSISAFAGYDTGGDFALQSVVRVSLYDPRMRRYVLTIEQATAHLNELTAAIKDAQARIDHIATRDDLETEKIQYKTVSDTTATGGWLIQRRIEE